MSEWEICQSYRLAKDKRQQVTILAQLNCTYPSQIIKILAKNGIYEKERRLNSETRKGSPEAIRRV